MGSPHWGLIILAAIVNFFIGWAWYSKLFGKFWTREMGLDEPGKMEALKQKSSPSRGMIINFIMGFLMIFVFYWLIYYLNLTSFAAYLVLAFMLWLGFVVPLTIGSVLWEGRSWKLFWLNSLHTFVELLVASIIYSLWG